MPISETRLAVRLQDNASSGLQSLTNQYNRFANTIQNSGNKIAQFNRQAGGANMGGFAANINSAANSLSNMNKMMERLVYSASRYFVIYKAMGVVGDVWQTVVNDSYEYAKSLESNQIGIAGILKSMVKLNGENIKWNDAMAISQKSMKALQSEALRTAATSQELIETFRAILGPGMAAGMNIDQIVKLSTVGTNAVRSLGLPSNQYVQELRSIITGGIRPASSTLATSLGITNKDVKEAKASAEGLYGFLMKRMEGFADAVKYTSGTVEGRIARIKEGINVGVASASQELYKSFSGVLEKIADALIPVPKDLGAKWQINPEFVSGVKRVTDMLAKFTEGAGNIGSFLAPLGKGGLEVAFTVLDKLAGKLEYIFTIFAVRKLSPYVTDLVNLTRYSREAYDAQTWLGKALQAVNDKLKGRTADLQRVIAEQNIYNASIDAFFTELNRVNTINGIVNNSANSVTNLATKWQKMGMDAGKAVRLQNDVLKSFSMGLSQTGQDLIRHGDAVAQNIEKTRQYEAAVKNAYNEELQAIRKVIAEQNNKGKTSKVKVESFLGNDKSIKWQVESTNELIGKLQQLKLEEQQIYDLALQYVNALKRGGQEAAAVISNQIVKSGENIVAKQKLLATKQEEINLDNKIALEQSALANAYRQGGEAAYQSLNKIIAQEKRIVEEMQKRGLITVEVEERHIQLLNAVASAQGTETGAIIRNTEAVQTNEIAQLGLNAAKEKGIDRALRFTSALGGLSMGIGILCDFLGQADEKNKEWWESAGNAAMQAGMFAMAISSIAGAVKDMIPALAKGIAWLNKFAGAKAAAGLGLAGGIAAAVGGIISYKYNEFENTRVASAYDDEGNLISHTFSKPDDADDYAIIDDKTYNYGNTANDVTAGNLELKYPPDLGGGGSKGGGGGSKVDKAEQSAAKMKQFVEDLNKEITNLDGKATAYDKTMATAMSKIASQEKEIVKAQQLGVDVGEVRNKQLEYSIAMEKKAWESQQDEYLKWMKMDEDSAKNIFTMGGTMEEQRKALAEKLEVHRDYLNEILAGEIENKERRMQLEQELASVTKQIQENSVYEFKEGWKQALIELANQQINFKDAFVSAFGSIENSLVELVSGAGSAKDKFKRFCEDVTNTILKSMTQIIIKGLITKAIMAAIGLFSGGGGSVISNGSLLGSITDSPYASLAGGFIGYTGARASGGSVNAGGTYLVGEQGPELVRFGSAGRVYSNNETKSMLGSNPQNIKIELINESGTELKSENAQVKFDLDTMIISTVIKGVNNNTMNMRTMLKGLATT